MAFVKKLALGSIFISILCIFGMSHNANAIDFNLNLDNYSIIRDAARQQIDASINDNLTYCSATYQCIVYNNTDFATVKKIKTTNSYPFKANDVVILTMFIGSQSNVGTYTSVVPFIQRNFTTANNNLIYLGYDEHSITDRNFISSLGYGPNADEFYTNLQSYYNQLSIVRYYFRVLADGNYNLGFESTNYASVLGDIFSLASYSSSNSVIFSVQGVQGWRPVESKENKEVEEKTQEAVDDSQAAGSGSSSSASQGGANLLSAITGFFNVITSAQPTNCRFNAPLNTYFGNQNLNVDLCALDLPQGIGALTSIIAIGILIPFAIHMFNKFIALFRSFQS